MAEEKEKPLTREDVLRLIEENGGEAKGLDLSGKRFEEGIDLRELDLTGIVLVGSHLEGAKLWRAHLERADLEDAHLEQAYLGCAHLEGADLGDAHLKQASLREAHLEGADLTGVELSPDTKLENVHWGNYILGEETGRVFYAAVLSYRRLKQWHTNAGMYDVAGKFFYREMEARRKSRHWKAEPHLKLWDWILRLLCGYGEEWSRVIISAAAVVFGLAAAYYFWGSFTSPSFWDTLYYSATSFVALGYGQWAPQPIGWAKGVGAAEAFVGVFMMALFLVTFIRKMTR